MKRSAIIALVIGLFAALALPALANYIDYDHENGPCSSQNATGDGYVYNKTLWDATFKAGDATVLVYEVGGKTLAGPAQRPFNNRKIPSRTWVRIWDSGDYPLIWYSIGFHMEIPSGLDSIFDVRVNGHCS